MQINKGLFHEGKKKITWLKVCSTLDGNSPKVFCWSLTRTCSFLKVLEVKAEETIKQYWKNPVASKGNCILSDGLLLENHRGITSGFLQKLKLTCQTLMCSRPYLFSVCVLMFTFLTVPHMLTQSPACMLPLILPHSRWLHFSPPSHALIPFLSHSVSSSLSLFSVIGVGVKRISCTEREQSTKWWYWILAK